MSETTRVAASQNRSVRDQVDGVSEPGRRCFLQSATAGGIDPNRAAIAFGPDDILAQPRYAAQGGIMSTNKAFQRVA